jgi:6-pyruvoyltetrahydropterin/6-carboxytetrahydropterin synthase
MEDIGYAIDFKEVKRVGCQWIDDILDHGMILNPHDIQLIDVTKALGSKMWLMSLNGKENYCNPSAENISKEIFLAMMVLFEQYSKTLKISAIKLYETPNCYVLCKKESISDVEAQNWMEANYEKVHDYALEKGKMEYDSRKITVDI